MYGTRNFKRYIIKLSIYIKIGSEKAKESERNKESARSEKKEEQKDAPKAGGSKGLFGGMLSGLNQDDIGDIEGPARENWQF